MSEKEKARPLVAQEVSQAETAAYSEAAVPYEHFTSNPAARQPGFFANLLLQRQENAIPLRQLKAITGMKDRTIRNTIESERRRGIPVLSDNVGGYFLPADEGEKERFIKSMQHRAGEILKSAAAIERGGVSG